MDRDSEQAQRQQQAQRVRERIDALPAPIRAQVMRMLQKFPADQVDSLLASGSPLIERALHKAEAGKAAVGGLVQHSAEAKRDAMRRASTLRADDSATHQPSHPGQHSASVSTSASDLLERLAATRRPTVVHGDKPGVGLPLVIGVLVGLGALAYVLLGK
ncbi:MAG: hypothetical protein ABIQ97_01540 [Lysobacteraceae bacterium]